MRHVHVGFVLAGLVLGAFPVAAHAQEAPPPEGPGAGAYEVALSGDLARLFNSETSGLNIGLGLGYYVSDVFEILVNANVSYVTDEARSADNTPGGGGTLTVGAVPAVGAGAGGWTTALTAGARFFLPGRRFSAAGIAPFVSAEAGALFIEEVDPFIIASASVGVRLPIGSRAAFNPQAGYVFIHATDDNAGFGDSDSEHAIAVSWSLSVFF